MRNRYEELAWKKKSYVCGIDEAGRGCLCGPVVVAAAILPFHATHPLLRDSKTMSPAQRDKAYAWITQHAFFSTVFVDINTIEERNIYHATRIAMQKTFIQLLEVISFSPTKISHLISDAMPLTFDPVFTHDALELYHPAHAESLSSTVAAASIIAKVTRDNFMTSIEHLFPAFALSQHKGYGTKAHKDALLAHGPSIIHRPSFIRTITQGQAHAQQTIC